MKNQYVIGNSIYQKTTLVPLNDRVDELAKNKSYIKKIQIGNVVLFTVVNADGKRIALAPCHRRALLVAVQMGLEVIEIQ